MDHLKESLNVPIYTTEAEIVGQVTLAEQKVEGCFEAVCSLRNRLAVILSDSCDGNRETPNVKAPMMETELGRRLALLVANMEDCHQRIESLFHDIRL